MVENLEEDSRESGVGFSCAVHKGNADCFPAMDYGAPLYGENAASLQVPQSSDFSFEGRNASLFFKKSSL